MTITLTPTQPTMHQNSLNAYRHIRDEMNKRETLIYGLLSQNLRSMTDREIMTELGFPEPNCVRPRITELIKNYWLRETGTVTDATSRVEVRKVRAISAEERKTILQMLMKDKDQLPLFGEAA
jgi:hypothetical protein